MLCPECSSEFEPLHKNQRFCNAKCARKQRYRKNAEKLRLKKREYDAKKAGRQIYDITTIKRICPECQKEFSPKNKKQPHQKYCSIRCRNNYVARIYRDKHRGKINQNAKVFREKNKELMRQRWSKYRTKKRGGISYDITKIKRICPYCKTEFSPKNKFHPNQEFCSDRCRSNFNRRKYYWQNPEKERALVRKHPKPEDRPLKLCDFCKKEFKPTSLYQPFMKYCSKKCMRQAIEKKSYWNNRDKKIEKVKKYLQTDAGKKMKRAAAKKSAYNRRLGSPFDKKFSRKAQEYVIKRENNTCVYCHATTKRMTFDHIVSLNIIKKEKKALIPIANTPLNIVRCCQSCNGSKQDVLLGKWLGLEYCKLKGITKENINPIVWRLLEKQQKIK